MWEISEFSYILLNCKSRTLSQCKHSTQLWTRLENGQSGNMITNNIQQHLKNAPVSFALFRSNTLLCLRHNLWKLNICIHVACNNCNRIGCLLNTHLTVSAVFFHESKTPHKLNSLGFRNFNFGWMWISNKSSRISIFYFTRLATTWWSFGRYCRRRLASRAITTWTNLGAIRKITRSRSR